MHICSPHLAVLIKLKWSWCFRMKNLLGEEFDSPIHLLECWLVIEGIRFYFFKRSTVTEDYIPDIPVLSRMYHTGSLCACWNVISCQLLWQKLLRCHRSFCCCFPWSALSNLQHHPNHVFSEVSHIESNGAYCLTSFHLESTQTFTLEPVMPHNIHLLIFVAKSKNSRMVSSSVNKTNSQATYN